jgi:hypothetical protein
LGLVDDIAQGVAVVRIAGQRPCCPQAVTSEESGPKAGPLSVLSAPQ